MGKAYAAHEPGRPGYCAVQWDDPKDRAITAAALADWITRGYSVERVTKAQAMAGIHAYMVDKLSRLTGERSKLQPFADTAVAGRSSCAACLKRPLRAPALDDDG